MAEDFKITLQELPGAIEAILFVSGDPVNAEKIADILDCSKADVVKTLNDLMNRYEQNPWSGLTIVRAEDSYVMMTKPYYYTALFYLAWRFHEKVIRVCGKISQKLLVFGRIWITLM